MRRPLGHFAGPISGGTGPSEARTLGSAFLPPCPRAVGYGFRETRLSVQVHHKSQTAFPD